MTFTDWGLITYKEAWDRQRAIVESMTTTKALPEQDEQQVIFCEHPHVYTLGRHGKTDNLLISESVLTRIGAEFYHTNRGGDITYHGPGQVVAYPILRLDQLGIGVKQYVERLEEVVIRTVAAYGLHATRLPQAAGVWLDPHSPRARKLCAIGVRCSHAVTMHGFALNVNTDLRCFALINPCGFTDKGVTSLGHELGAPQDFEHAKRQLYSLFRDAFPGNYEL